MKENQAKKPFLRPSWKVTLGMGIWYFTFSAILVILYSYTASFMVLVAAMIGYFCAVATAFVTESLQNKFLQKEDSGKDGIH